MGKYIVQVTKRQKQEIVVDAGSPEEAKRRGLEKLNLRLERTAGR